MSIPITIPQKVVFESTNGIQFKNATDTSCLVKEGTYIMYEGTTIVVKDPSNPDVRNTSPYHNEIIVVMFAKGSELIDMNCNTFVSEEDITASPVLKNHHDGVSKYIKVITTPDTYAFVNGISCIVRKRVPCEMLF